MPKAQNFNANRNFPFLHQIVSQKAVTQELSEVKTGLFNSYLALPSTSVKNHGQKTNHTKQILQLVSLPKNYTYELFNTHRSMAPEGEGKTDGTQGHLSQVQSCAAMKSTEYKF